MKDQTISINNIGKLSELGFKDGYEKATRIIKENPENIDLLQAIELPIYYEAFRQGIEAAKRDFGLLEEAKPIQK